MFFKGCKMTTLAGNADLSTVVLSDSCMKLLQTSRVGLRLFCTALIDICVSFRYTVTFSCDCNKFCCHLLKTLAVSEAYRTVYKNIFVSNKTFFRMELVFHSNNRIKSYWKLHEENIKSFYIDHLKFLKFIKYLAICSIIKKVQVYTVWAMAPFLDDDKEQRERVSSNVLLAMDSFNK